MILSMIEGVAGLSIASPRGSVVRSMSSLGTLCLVDISRGISLVGGRTGHPVGMSPPIWVTGSILRLVSKYLVRVDWCPSFWSLFACVFFCFSVQFALFLTQLDALVFFDGFDLLWYLSENFGIRSLCLRSSSVSFYTLS